MKWFRSSGKTEDYEKEFLARYNEQQEPKQKKNTSKDKKSIKKEIPKQAEQNCKE